MQLFSFSTSGNTAQPRSPSQGFDDALARQQGAPAPASTRTPSAPTRTLTTPTTSTSTPTPAPASEGLTLTGTDGNDVLIGSDGTDTITTGAGFDIVRSGEGRDRITVSDSGFIDAGGPNNDIVFIVGDPQDFQRTEFGNGIVVFSGNDGRVIILKDAEAVAFKPSEDSPFAQFFEPPRAF